MKTKQHKSSIIRSPNKENESKPKQELKTILRFLKTELVNSNLSNKYACRDTMEQYHTDKSDKDAYSVIEKLKSMKPEERVRSISISKAIMIEDLIMEEKTKSLSKYILK
jgi:hypothetical protein